MKFNNNKYDVEQFAYDLRVLNKMIGMSDKQIFKDSFLPQNKRQLLQTEDIDTTLVKARALVLLFKV